MHNDQMNAAIEAQINWVKQCIQDQVDTGMENFAIAEAGEIKLLEFTQVVVDAIVGKMDVQHALCYCQHLQQHGALQPGADRLTALHHYFYDWIALQLAMRYA